jgi:NAD-dependent SIR2 family protein deacetylase
MDVLRATMAVADCDAVLVVGTSAVVYPAAGFPIMAKEKGAVVVEINIEPTPVTEYADISLFGTAEEVLPALVDAIKQGMERE